MRPRTVFALSFVVSLACVTSPIASQTSSVPTRRVVLISFDAGADWIVDELIARGKAPAFAAVAREGAQADAMISVIPSLTAAAHASLWTGAFPRSHGATDNSMPMAPAAAHTVIERRSGYLSDVLRAEPIWDTAARYGKRVMVIQASNGFPFTNRFPDRVTHFDVYANELLRSALVNGSVGPDGLAFTIGDTHARVTGRDGSSVTLTVGDAHAALAPGTPAFSAPLSVRVGGVEGQTRVGLLEYDAATGRTLLLRGDVVRLVGTDAAARDALMAEAGITVGEVGSGYYQAGGFGRTLADGGTGAAERHLVNATLANQQYFDGALRYAARQPWDLLVLYAPNMDVAGHALVGMLDPDTPGHDPALAEKIWSVYEEMFRRCMDDYVTAIRRLAPDATLVIGADHGVEGNRRWWYPNAVLRDAGLLGENIKGGVDLATTRALFLYSHGGGIFLNSTRFKDGVVTDDQRRDVKAAVRHALLSARDPETGTPLARAVVDTDLDGEALGIGGEFAPDLYFDPTPGYQASARFSSKVIVGPPLVIGMGAHGPFPTRRRLHGIFYAVGPGVRAGARPGIVRQVDPAPTVARLLGIPAPANSVGRALPIE
ncbi:MAG: alkaline phosphatase family protein [Vicinamibacteria bacterium]|nr:alkaline phosphatase family protein [Vicinamibacteria bacterium]